VLIHFYRAVVAHADVWRQRMDATTNWAAATSAVMITFVFGSATSPHFVLVLALAFDMVFLLMESRRYQVYDLWRRRFRAMDRYLIVPALVGEPPPAGDDPEAARALQAEGLRRLAVDLSNSVPPLRFMEALSYRIRRNYGYLVLVVIGAWLLKLEVHPTPALTLEAFVRRAAVGPIAGEFVLFAVALYALAIVTLALAGPSEQMRDWRELPSPLGRMRGLGRSAPEWKQDLE